MQFPSSLVLMAHSLGETALTSIDLATLPTEGLPPLFVTASGQYYGHRAAYRIESSNHYVDVLGRLYEEMERRGPEAQRAFLELLSHEDWFVRWQAAYRALELDSAAALDALAGLDGLDPQGVLLSFEIAHVLKVWRNKERNTPGAESMGDEAASSDSVLDQEARPVPVLESLDDWDEWIEERGLSHLGAALRPALRPSFWLCRQMFEEEQIPLGASKIGGHPDLPLGVEWPSRKGRRLTFMGQIRLSEFSEGEGPGELPERGLLYFFGDADAVPGIYSDDDAQSGAVIYSEHEDGLVRSVRPVDLLPGLVLKSAAVEPVFEWMLPAYEAPWMLSDTMGDEDAEAVFELGEAWDSEAREAESEGFLSPRHQLLGYPRVEQAPMEEELASEKGEPADWVLLLQIDSDEAGTMWGDGGKIYFWILRKDLKRRRFDRVAVRAQGG